MGSTDWLILAGVAVCAAGSFVFALAETSLFALTRWQARQLAEESPAGATVMRLLSQPSELLTTIVLGNTMANGGIVALALWPVLENRWPLPGTLLGTFTLILFGCEVLPKTLAVRLPERWALRVSPVVLLIRQATAWAQRSIQIFTSWLLKLLVSQSVKPQTGVSDEEYHELLEMAYQQGALEKSEKDIILQIISLDRKTAGQVMKPRSQMAALSDDLSIEDMIEAARRLKHRRLPLYDETPDTIVGVLNTRKLLLDPDGDLADAIEFPSFVPETMNLLQLLKSLQRQQRGLAVVLDEFGGTAGLVTTEEILEEVVGAIRAQPPPQGFVIEKLAEAKWRVSGAMLLEDFRREYEPLGHVPGVFTMGGLLVHLLEVVPTAGQSALFRGLRLTALVVEERRVKELLVEQSRKK